MFGRTTFNNFTYVTLIWNRSKFVYKRTDFKTQGVSQFVYIFFVYPKKSHHLLTDFENAFYLRGIQPLRLQTTLSFGCSIKEKILQFITLFIYHVKCCLPTVQCNSPSTNSANPSVSISKKHKCVFSFHVSPYRVRCGRRVCARTECAH